MIYRLVVPNVEHLKLIQTVIERMAHNSFALKGWAVTLVVALLGLAANQSDALFALLAVYVVVCFGTLDAYYLALERKYRTLYNVASQQIETEHWGLAVDRPGWREVQGAIASPSVLPYYGIALVIAIAVGVRAG